MATALHKWLLQRMPVPTAGAPATNLQAGLRLALTLFPEGTLPRIVVATDGLETDDRLGRLKLTKAGLAARDELVLSECRRRDLPVAIAMAGGYARQIDDTVSIHAATIETARRIFTSARQEHPCT